MSAFYCIQPFPSSSAEPVSTCFCPFFEPHLLHVHFLRYVALRREWMMYTRVYKDIRYYTSQAKWVANLIRSKMATTTIRIKKVCEWCGKEFEAQRCSTRFCSKACTDHAYKEQKRQERKRATEAAVVMAQHQKKTLPLKEQEFLSVAEASHLLHVTRDVVYKLIYRGTLKAYRLSSRLTIIRRTDIEAMIEARPYERTPGLRPASKQKDWKWPSSIPPKRLWKSSE